MKTLVFLTAALLLVICVSSVSFSATNLSESEIQGLIRLLGDNSYETRSTAANSLLEIGADAVPALTDALSDPDWHIRMGAAEALSLFGAHARVAIPTLIGQLSDEENRVRAQAAKTFAALGPMAYEAVPDLIIALNDEFPTVRGSAAWALGEIGADPDKTIPALAKAIYDEKWWVRDRSAQGLANFGVAAVPALRVIMADATPTIAWHAVDAIGLIGPSAAEAIPDLMNMLWSQDASLRSIAANSIGLMGEAAIVTVPSLIEKLSDPDEWVRGAAAEALARIGKYAVDATGKLITVLAGDSSGAVRAQAAMALGNIGVQPGVVPALIGALSDKDNDVVQAAKTALRTLGLMEITLLSFSGSDPVSVLIAALGSDNVEVRKDVAFALGEYGPKAAGAVTKLDELAKNETNDETRWYYRDAIGKIEGEG